MRVFFALTFNDDTKNILGQYRDLIAGDCIKGRFTRTDNFHLTLQFIGEVDYKALDLLCSILYKLERGPKELRLEGLGSFKQHREEILWFGLKKDPELISLQKQLTNQLALHEIEFDKRSYKPHITIGRQVSGFVNSSGLFIDAIVMPIKSIALMESKHVDGHLVYEAVEEVKYI